MGCDLVFKITGNLKDGSLPDGGLPIVTIKDSGLLSDELLKKLPESTRRIKGVTLKNVARELMKNKEEKAKLISFIKSLADELNRTVTASTITKEGIIGNNKFEVLRYKYADNPKVIPFPKLTTPYNPDILLVKSLRIDGRNMTDAIYGTDANGNIVYIVEDSERGVNKLYGYLQVRDLVLNKFENNDELGKLMPKIERALKKQFNSQRDLLLDFLANKSEYRKLPVKDGIYELLSETVKGLRSKYGTQYANPLDRAFDSRLDWIKGSKNDYLISKSKFLDIVESHAPELLEGRKRNDINDELLAEIFNKLYPSFEEFSGKLLKVTDKHQLKIHKKYNTLADLEDITYDTIKDFMTEPEPPYKGFHIYEYKRDGVTRYKISQDRITPNSEPGFFNSVEEAMAEIDKRISTDYSFKKGFRPEFLKIPIYETVLNVRNEGGRKYLKGLELNILDIELDRDTVLDPQEKALIEGDKLLSDFYSHFKRQLSTIQFTELTETILSVEDAGVFTYLVNLRVGHVRSARKFKSNAEHLAAFDQIIKDIQEAHKRPYKKYYILESNSGFTRIIPITDSVVINETYNRPQPIIGLLDEVVETLGERFGVEAEVLTLDLIDERFSDIPAGTRAFINEGKIYVNGSLATSTDVVHEYTHLFLGVLKATNYDMYMNLLELALKDPSMNYWKSKISAKYKNMATPDLNEEIFVAAFADFLSGKSTSNLFATVKSEVDKEMKGIFNLASDEDFNKLYKGGMKKVFDTFSKDIGKLGNEIDFSQGAIYRLAANWISKQIEAEKLIEKCE